MPCECQPCVRKKENSLNVMLNDIKKVHEIFMFYEKRSAKAFMFEYAFWQIHLFKLAFLASEI